MSKPTALLLALLMGLAAPFAFAPYNIWPLMPLSLAGLFWLLQRSNLGFRLGFAYGLTWFGYGIHWVHVSMAQFGGMPLLVTLFLMLLLVSYLSLYPALACWLIKRYQAKVGQLGLLLLLPGAWIAAEWLRSWVLTGFPWLQAAYSQIDSPLSAYAPLLGSLGLSWLVAFCAAALVLVIKNQHRFLAGGMLMAIFLSGLALQNLAWTQAQAPIKIALVQGNISLTEKWLADYRQPTLDMYQKASLSSDAEVIIWPESAIPALEYEVIDYLHQLDTQLVDKGKVLITGIITHDLQSHLFFNSLITLGQVDEDTGKSYYFEHANRYNKHHLLPIGEFVPFEDLLRPLAPYFNLPMSSFSRGAAQQANLQIKKHAWLAAICYEIAFGEQLRPQFSPETDAIITVSNDAWFGDSIGPWQHLEMAQMRALEFGRPVLRATNTGHTAVIDRFGKITDIVPSYQALTLEAEFSPATGVTPYQRWGSWPLFAILCVSALILITSSLVKTKRFKNA